MKILHLCFGFSSIISLYLLYLGGGLILKFLPFSQYIFINVFVSFLGWYVYASVHIVMLLSTLFWHGELELLETALYTSRGRDGKGEGYGNGWSEEEEETQEEL